MTLMRVVSSIDKWLNGDKAFGEGDDPALLAEAEALGDAAIEVLRAETRAADRAPRRRALGRCGGFVKAALPGRLGKTERLQGGETYDLISSDFKLFWSSYNSIKLFRILFGAPLEQTWQFRSSSNSLKI